MIVPVTHLIRDHAGSNAAPFTGRSISEIVMTTPDRDRAEQLLVSVSSIPQPLSVIGFRLGDALLEI